MGDDKQHLMESLFGEESEDDVDADRSAASYSEGEAESGGEREESEGEREASEGEKEEEVSRRSKSSCGEEEEGSVASGSEQNDAQPQDDNNELEAAQSEEAEQPGADRIREALGESDEDEQEEVRSHKPPTSPEGDALDMEGSYQKDVKPADIVEDEERYDTDEEQPSEVKKPKGEPLTVEVPLRPPPTQSHNMNLVRVSNIMDIEQKPFDAKTYVYDEEDERLRLEENIVRWRHVRNRDGSRSFESNARFVKWSDGSMQLLIGNEVLDLAVQDGQQDESHLFLRHSKGILQAQGRLVRKMRFMPSSLTSKSHRKLTALVESRHKKNVKVKNVVTDFDPEKDKEQKEKMAEQRIRSKEELQRKQEKTMRKYAPQREREPQLSPGYLEEALDEDEDEDYDDGRHRRYQEQLEAESRAERRINQAKRQPPKARKPPAPRSKRDMLEDESSEESEHRDRRNARTAVSDEEEEEEEAEEEVAVEEEEVEEEEKPKRRSRDEEEEENSPPRKQQVHRRKVVVSDSEED